MDHRIIRSTANPVRLCIGLLFAICLAAAQAGSVSVGDLRLDSGDAWQRAEPEEEAQAESVILRRADAVGLITVTIPRHRPRLRVPEARFYKQLETVWRAGAGDALRLSWLEAGGRRWRVARRPSLESPDRAVFHLVSVVDGLAEHLLVTVPVGVPELPPSVHALLSGEALLSPASNSVATANAAESRSTPTDPSGLAPGWQLTRILKVLPAIADFDALVQQERQRLQPDGGITGMGLYAQAHGLTAYLSGFVLTTSEGTRQRRHDLNLTWDVAWEPPAHELPSGAALQLRISRLPTGVGLRVRLHHYYCGSAEEVLRLEQSLQHAVVPALEGVKIPGCGTITAGGAQAEILGSADPPRPVTFSVEAPPLPERQQHLLVLSITPFVIGNASGTALLGAAAVHYLYRLVYQP